ncbi:MAG: (Fe-S)-binding protein [Gammaproteobacteria bacterium]|nr:(Fe-S)-binding protein [Gammaproteobacteria bacterium]
METVAPFAEAIEEIKKAGAESCRLCYQCGKCDVYCPWNKVRIFSIRKIIREAAFGLTEIEGEDIWRCTTCGYCPSQCPRGVKQIEIGVSLRRVASEYGVFPSSVRAVRSVKGSLATEGNPLNDYRVNRTNWAKGMPVNRFTEGMDLLYFVGCYYCYDPRLKKVAVATANILNKAGVNFGTLGTIENCCGESIRKTGGEEVFRSLAKANIKNFIDQGVKKILVSSPHCYHTLKNEYSEFMVHLEVVHISQLLAKLIHDGKLKLTGDYRKKVAYHDPCYLGRHNNIYDEPREVLKRVPGLELIEMPDSRQDSLCCGGGGGRIWMETPKNERFSDLRLEQAKKVGADVLATSCPYCITNFEESRLALEGDEVLDIRDITEIIHEVI